MADAKGQPSVAVVNVAFAKRFYGTPQNAIGKLISEGGLKTKGEKRSTQYFAGEGGRKKKKSN